MVSANGADFASREAGRGDAVVLVHGSVSDLRCWSRTVEALGQSHRAIAYGRRYARPNAEIADGADDPLHAHVDDPASLIATWQADPAHLVGIRWVGSSRFSQQFVIPAPCGASC